jgi:hypothetical protein
MPENLTWRRVPRAGYAYTVAAIIVGLLLAAAAFWVWRETLPPLERYYTWTYLRLGLKAHLPVAPHNLNRFEAGYEYLRRNIFGSRSVLAFFRPALVAGGSCLMLALFAGMGLDAKRLNDFRKGKRLRGWEILTPRQFNRRTKGDGFALQIEE